MPRILRYILTLYVSAYERLLVFFSFHNNGTDKTADRYNMQYLLCQKYDKTSKRTHSLQKTKPYKFIITTIA